MNPLAEGILRARRAKTASLRPKTSSPLYADGIYALGAWSSYAELD
jgi:hypothetical protein